MRARQANRSSVRWQVQVRTESGARHFGTIIDLSADGCRIELYKEVLRVRSQILVKPDGLNALDGTVRWATGSQFGVAFDRPIYGPVLEHFLRQHSALALLIKV